MAWFHFCTANHNTTGRSSVVDLADWFEAGLLDLGHKVTHSDNHLESSAINIFWEYFTPRMGREIADAGVVYGIVATEIPDGHAFNWRHEPHWKARFEAFIPVANRAAFIWTMSESTLPFYSQFCPAAYMELGFSERLIPDYIDQKPEYDFCFFGQKTPYRETLIQKIEKHAKVEWPANFLTPEGVGRLIGASRIGLNFKQSHQWPVPSPTRLGRLMMAKRGVAAEFVSTATRQGEITGLCPETSDFSCYALDMLNSNWKQRAEEVFENYRSKMPMRDIIQCVLEKTVTFQDEARARSISTVTERKKSFNIDLAKDKNIINDRVYIEPEDNAVLIGSVGQYNMIFYRNKFIGLPQSLGPIDITQHDFDEFTNVCESQEELEAVLAILSHSQGRIE